MSVNVFLTLKPQVIIYEIFKEEIQKVQHFFGLIFVFFILENNILKLNMRFDLRMN